jgi:DNA-directed RNA polymerase subunit L/DNA-directed RNA polymerase alpha subunit
MDPKISNVTNKYNKTTFTLSNCNLPIANGIRRTVLSDIPILVMKCLLPDEDLIDIFYNTSNLNNEVLKLRISSIPVCIQNITDFNTENIVIELNIENSTTSIMTVTSEHFKIKDKILNKYLPQEKVKEIFPPNDLSGDFIDIVRLKPKLSEEIPGEKISLEAKLSVGTAKEDGMFNVVSTMSFGNTIDINQQQVELSKIKQTWKDLKMNEKEILYEEKNWLLLEGQRIFLPNSYDFIIENIGIYNNYELLSKSVYILSEKLDFLLENFGDSKVISVVDSENTMSNCFDVIIENEDYTIGKIIQDKLYTEYFPTGILTYCGFKKDHPHDSHSIIRLAYKEPSDTNFIKQNFESVFGIIKNEFNKIIKELKKTK